MQEYISQHQDRFLNELFELLRIPSVSANPAHKSDMQQTAQWLMAKLRTAGMDTVEIHPTAGNPIVYAEKITDPSRPTVLVYGHYDVQPADPVDLWHSAPFEPEIRNGRIYARGACDDKGQLYMHIKVLEYFHSIGVWPCNVKCMIEGEEEIGSNNLELFVKSNREKLKADMVLISDTGIISNDCPSVTVGLRGLSYLEVKVTGPNRDLHSGMYGGAVPNPINILCEMIASLHDGDNRITIPGFYDDVAKLTEQERATLNQAPFVLDEYKKMLGLGDVHGETGYTTIERVSIRPTLDVNGIWGGYTGEGAKTVIPSTAHAKLSMRLVPNQSSAKITQLFTDHFNKIAPPSVQVSVMPHHGGEAAVIATDSKAFRAACKAFEKVWGKPPIPTREGGSIPIVALFKLELAIDTLLMGFGLDEDAIHSPNESFGVFNYLKGIETIAAFYTAYSA